MQSILRFFVVLGLVFGTALLWRTDQKSNAAIPPANSAIGVDPQEEVKRALRPLGLTPLQEEWSKETFQARLEDAFDRNDPCTVIGMIGEEASVSPEARWAAGMNVLLSRQRKKSPALEELFATENSPLLGKPNEESRRLETRFFNALLYSNQLEGYDQTSNFPHRNPHRNMEKAVATFQELAQEEPENGAHNFFLAQAIRFTSAKKEESENAFQQASKAARFNTYYQQLYDSLLQISFDNLASFAWVYSFLQGAPSPSFSSSMWHLKNWAKGAEPGKWAANRIAKKLIDTGSKFKSDSPGYLYSQTEYVLGYGLRYTVDGRAENNREDYMKRMKEVREFISETPESLGLAETEIYREKFNDRKSECQWSSWQALYEVYQAKRKKI